MAVEVRAVRAADLTLCLTEATKELLVKASGVSKEKVVSIPDSVDLARCQRVVSDEEVDEFRARHAISRNSKVVMFVGRISYEKGWPHILNLAERLRAKNVITVFVGDGPQRDMLKEGILKKGLGESIRITGFVSPDTVPVALRLGTVVVMPSLHEEFGGTALEAMVAGKPVVGFGVGGLKETLNRWLPMLMVSPGDSESLYRVVDAVLHGGGPSEAILARNARDVAETHSLDALIGKLIAAYHRVLNTPKEENDA